MFRKKSNKNDIINLIILTIIFVVIILFTIKNKYIWGSYLDWLGQHSIIPEYFRTLFYDTHNLFPNLALNLGAGQNIYNYAYYGLLNPVVLFSYLLPFVSMRTYIMFSSLACVYCSVLLFYYFLKKNKYDSKIIFLSTLCFMLASPLLFHSHRHIMFINYMPFLILALIGVDNYFKNNMNRVLLSVSVLCIVLMSYYYSIPSILCIVIYGVYKYISLNKKITIKMFLYDGFRFLIPIVVGVLCSSILLVPELGAILSGRMESVVNINLFELVLPKANIDYLTYSAYGIGLSGISVLALINIFFSRKREDKYLGIILSIIIAFPLFNSVLNGLMYINAKTLIPLLPMYVLVITKFINKIYERKIDYKRLVFITIIVSLLSYVFKTYGFYYIYIDIVLTLLVLYISIKKKHFEIFRVYLIVLLISISLITNSSDDYVLKNDKLFINQHTQEELIKSITSSDKDIYRITTLIGRNDTENSIFNNIDMYQNHLYSSIYNTTYNKFYYDIFNNPMQSRNRVITSSNNNIMFLMFMGNKYLLSDGIETIGYSKYKQKNGIVSYVNNDVFPYMYINYNSFNKSEFDKMEFPYKNEVLLNYVVTDNGKTKHDTKIKEFNVENIEHSDLTINKYNNQYKLTTTNESKVYVDLPKEAFNKIIMIKLDMNLKQSCDVGDQAIIINGVINKLTCKEWKYYNGNTTFTYVISEKNIKSLEVEFFDGEYLISNIQLYYLDYNDIKDNGDLFTKVNVNKDKTKGDKIYASVEAKKDGYFVTTIPYQEGFSIYMDNKKIEYENINGGFIGFKINEGKHNIIFIYKSPFKTCGVVISLLGIIFLTVLIIEEVRSKNERKYKFIKK